MALPGFKKEGPRIVQRDENDRLVKDERGKPIAATLPTPAELKFKTPKQKKATWRSVLGKLTRDANGVDGGELLINHLNLAKGTPQVHTLPDGRQSEPVLITPEVQRAANSELMQMMFGKAVAASEMSKALEDERETERLRAMSDEQLKQLIEGDFKVLPQGEDGD